MYICSQSFYISPAISHLYSILANLAASGGLFSCSFGMGSCIPYFRIVSTETNIIFWKLEFPRKLFKGELSGVFNRENYSRAETSCRNRVQDGWKDNDWSRRKISFVAACSFVVSPGLSEGLKI